MKKIILLIIVLTLASCNNHNEVKYVNKEYSIDVGLDDLMSRMTLEEKVAQMTQFVGLNYITDADRNMTAEEIAGSFMDGKFTARQINGKALSLEMTAHVKPAEKKVTPRTYTEAEEATISDMVGEGKFLEEIADAMGRSANSIRGKLLSMGLKAPQRDKKDTKADPYAGIEDMLDQTVEEIAEAFDKTVRGVKTVLTRRGLSCADYTPKAAGE